MNTFLPVASWARFFASMGIILPVVASRAADVQFYGVFKNRVSDQTSTAPPAPKGNPYRFDAVVGLAAPNSVTSATVRLLPGGPIQTLAAQANSFQFQAKFKTLSALEAAAPNGNYQMVINGATDGMHTVTLSLHGDAYPSSDPHVSNFDAAQTINPGAAFKLTWDPFTGGKANDFILVQIQDILGNLIFQTPGPGQPGSLNGTNTSLVIPANTLPPATSLGGTLLFGKFVTSDLTSYPGAMGFAGYASGTDFSIQTIGTASPDVVFRLSVLSPSVSLPFQLALTGAANRSYIIEASSDLLNGSWMPLITNLTVAGKFIFPDSQSSNFPVRFYRGRTGN